MQRRSFVQAALTSMLLSACDIRRGRLAQTSAVGDGPEFEPWKTWRGEAAHNPLTLVRAAILAANAHNTQPWLFAVSNARIELYADTARNIGAGDPYLREMHLSLGCTLENLAVAAAPNGYVSSVEVLAGTLEQLVGKPEPQRVAVVELGAGRRVPSELYEAIPNRHTNRGLYDPARPLPSDFVATLRGLTEGDEVKLFVFTDSHDRKRIVDLSEASNPIYRDSAVRQGTLQWGRASEEAMHKLRDGFLTVPDPATKGIAHPTIMLSAPLFGLIAVRDRYDRGQTLRAGRVLQRAHLLATVRAIGARADNGAVELADYQRRLNQSPTAAARLAELIGDPTWQPTLVFYMGYPMTPAPISARRPVSDVLLSANSARQS